MKFRIFSFEIVLILLVALTGFTHGSTTAVQEYGLQKKDNCAIVTLVYQSHNADDGFVIGAQNLGYSLLLSKTKHHMVALVTEHVSKYQQAELGRAGWNIKLVKAIKNHNQEYASRLDYIFSKLQIFSLIEYDRVVYLDADTMVTGSIDDLCTCTGRYCAVVRNTFFNAGVMVVEPNEDLYFDMIRKSTDLHSYTGGDQGFVNNYFWNTERCPFYNPREELPPPDGGASCHRLPGFYNGDVGMFVARGNKWQFDPNEDITTPLVIHYTLSIFKPWRWWSYPVVTESWKWWDVLTRSSENVSQLGIFTSIMVITPMIVIWSLLAVYEFKPKMFYPAQSKRRIISLYQMSSFFKTLSMHLLNINCLAIAFFCSNLPAIHPYANAFVMFFAYCTFFEIICIQMFNFLFKEPVPELSIQSLATSAYTKPPYPKKLNSHRMIVYLSSFIFICLLMIDFGNLFLKIAIAITWGILIPTIELTFFVVKEYPSNEYNIQ